LQGLGQCRRVVERVVEERIVLTQRHVLFFLFGRVAQPARSNTSGLSQGFVNTILNEKSKFNTNALGVLDDFSLPDDSLNFGLCYALRVCAKESEPLLLFERVRTWGLPLHNLGDTRLGLRGLRPKLAGYLRWRFFDGWRADFQCGIA
jgi:hypothetical protein